ncbi:MAG: nucleotidyl transferase AbiEii/AbiGii toxin family protein [Candidatus Micrarchaeia archaeon]
MPFYEELKTEEQRRIAMLQDTAIDIVDRAIKSYALHGGTAIWRCYNGNRFSYDLDFYFGEKDICKKIMKIASAYSLRFDCSDKRKVYAKLYGYSAHVGIQADLKKVKGTPVSFLKYNGSAITVFVLSPTDLFLEKISAYKDRLESKDLYDLYQLASGDLSGAYTINKAKIKPKLIGLLSDFKKPADNWQDLELMLLHGRLPTLEYVLSYLKKLVQS